MGLGGDLVYSREFGLLEGAMKWASAASESSSLEEALDSCVESVRGGLGSEPVDLAVVFASPHHEEGYERIPGMVAKRLGAKHLIGCSAGGVIGGGHEIEQRAGFSLTAASLPGVSIKPFHLANESLPDLDASPGEWETMVGDESGRYAAVSSHHRPVYDSERQPAAGAGLRLPVQREGGRDGEWRAASGGERADAGREGAPLRRGGVGVSRGTWSSTPSWRRDAVPSGSR